VSLVSGIDEADLVVIHSADIDKTHDPAGQHAADLAALRALPEVQAATVVRDSPPFDNSSFSLTACDSPTAMQKAHETQSSYGAGCANPSVYSGAPGELAVLGLHVVEGRDFLPGEYVLPNKHGEDSPPAAVISRALAERLYPGQDALGHEVYTGPGKPIRIVGIVDTLVRPVLRTPDVDYYTMLWPLMPADERGTYLLRVRPEDQAQAIKGASDALMKLNPDRILESIRPFNEIRHDYFQRDVTMIGLLLASLCGLLLVTAIGITGLANFWVQQRTRQIGIRRAVGATRGDILRYFQTENFIIVGTGVLLGLALAVVLNLALMHYYAAPHLPLFYLPVGALALWTLGQLAVLNPALQAARVPPATAARNV